MNVTEAKEKWGLSLDKIYQVCKELKIPKEKGGFVIPDELKKPYFPDRRSFRKKDKLHIYIHVLNAITDELLIIPKFIDTDEQHIRTAVRELKKTGAIVLLDGADDDFNYQHYMIGLNYSIWTSHNIKEKMELISNMASVAKDIREVVAG